MLLQLDKLCTEYFICMVKNDGGTTALWLSWPDNIIWITNAGVCLAWIVQARLNNWSSVKMHRFKHVPTCTLKMVTGLCNWSLESPTPFCSMVVKQAWYLTLNLGQHSSFLLNCDTVCLRRWLKYITGSRVPEPQYPDHVEGILLILSPKPRTNFVRCQKLGGTSDQLTYVYQWLHHDVKSH